MYLLPIHVPIYVDGVRSLVTSEWWRALELLRNSLGGLLGDIIVVAPTLPVDQVETDQTLVPQSRDCGIQFIRGFDLRCRARDYWLRARSSWRRTLLELSRNAAAVHAGLDDVYRPIAFEGFRVGVQLNRVTLFVQDTDIVIQQRELAASAGTARRMQAWTYGSIFEQMCRWSVARADCRCSKARLHEALWPVCQEPKEFHRYLVSFQRHILSCRLVWEVCLAGYPQHRSGWVIAGDCATQGAERKPEILARAIAQGAQPRLEYPGAVDPNRRLLERRADPRDRESVSFLGARRTMRRCWSDSDRTMLFTPTAEDTPLHDLRWLRGGIAHRSVRHQDIQNAPPRIRPPYRCRGGIAASAAVNLSISCTTSPGG